MQLVILICLALIAPALSADEDFNAPPPDKKEDPEINMDPAQIIKRWGYVAEEYDVRTADNYTLKLYRIPYGKSGKGGGTPGAKRPIVYLQHGFGTSSADWVINLPQLSAGFVFADAGFDVFLGNFRGSLYGRKHDLWDTTTHFFWQFSLTDMALKDLPALLQTTKEAAKFERNDKFYFIGHSTGATAAFIFSVSPSTKCWPEISLNSTLWLLWSK